MLDVTRKLVVFTVLPTYLKHSGRSVDISGLMYFRLIDSSLPSTLATYAFPSDFPFEFESKSCPSQQKNWLL
jgi:hypothetical protein